MARRREFDEAKALAAAQDVFWRKGYEGASYADLMAATGLGKGSLYAAFGDKRALYVAALRAYIDEEIGALAAMILADGPAGPRERVAAAFDYAIEAVSERGERKGCFLCNASVDVAAGDPSVSPIIAEALKAAEAGFDQVAPGKGGHMLSVYLGLQVLARAGATVEAMRAARGSALESLGSV